MDIGTLAIIGGATAAGIASGIGLWLGARLLPVGLTAYRDLQSYESGAAVGSWRAIGDAEQQRRQLARPGGAQRETTIAGLYRNCLRHRDGSYTAGYELTLQPTMLSREGVAETRADDIARMLTAQAMPASTVLQFRYSVGPDPGAAIAEHLRARDYYRSHPPAARLHDLKVDFYKSHAEQGAFRAERASLFVKVPARHADDNLNQGVAAFIPAAIKQVRRRGAKRATASIGAAWRANADDGVVRRLKQIEEEVFGKAERMFRTVEMTSPFETKRLERDELWNAVYKNHVMGTKSVPKLPASPGADLRPYFSSQTVEDRGSYVMHGEYPVTVVSLFSPPDKSVAADSIREVTAHAGLTFPHTIVTEFVVLDRQQGIGRIKRRIRSVERATTKADGAQKITGEAKAALADLEPVLDSIVGSRDSLVEMRMYAVVYGDRATTLAELKTSLTGLDHNCDQLISALQTIDGVIAAREEPASLHCLYPQTLIGEADAKPTGREITEVASSLAAFVPCESAWGGSARPHTLLSTVSGRLIGLNLWDKSQRSKIKSPLVLVIAEPGGGKTTTCALLVNDSLATIPDLHVSAVDIGGTLAPHALATNARYQVLQPGDNRSLNIWDYPDLKDGVMAGDEDVNIIVLDAMTLAHVKPEDELASDILTKAVTQVLKNFVPRNGPNRQKVEPTHSHLVAMLESYDYGSVGLNERAKSLALALEKYAGNAYLDAPTHPDFLVEAPYDVYELEALDAFPPDVRASLANRIAARVVRTIGKLNADQTRTPTLLVFTEVWKLVAQYPMMMRVVQKGARTGRRDNVVTVLDTQTYDDFSGIHDVTKTAGVKIIGKQNGDFSKLVADAGLSPSTVSAINAIRNIDGVHAQFVLVLGSGNDQTVEMIQVDLSPAELWTFTSNPDERNARARVAALKPDWSLLEVIAWLAATYPRGLVAQGLNSIDESLLG